MVIKLYLNYEFYVVNLISNFDLLFLSNQQRILQYLMQRKLIAKPISYTNHNMNIATKNQDRSLSTRQT